MFSFSFTITSLNGYFLFNGSNNLSSVLFLKAISAHFSPLISLHLKNMPFFLTSLTPSGIFWVSLLCFSVLCVRPLYVYILGLGSFLQSWFWWFPLCAWLIILIFLLDLPPESSLFHWLFHTTDLAGAQEHDNTFYLTSLHVCSFFSLLWVLIYPGPWHLIFFLFCWSCCFNISLFQPIIHAGCC
jgi:hypothetical protein